MCGSGDEDLGNLCCPLMPDANALLWERGFLSANGLRLPYLSCMVFCLTQRYGGNWLGHLPNSCSILTLKLNEKIPRAFGR